MHVLPLPDTLSSLSAVATYAGGPHCAPSLSPHFTGLTVKHEQDVPQPSHGAERVAP